MRIRQTSQTVTGGRRSRDACFILHAGDDLTPNDLEWSGPLDAPQILQAGSCNSIEARTWAGIPAAIATTIDRP